MAQADALAAPDVQASNQTQLDGKSCVDYAHDRAKEYAAAVRFIGLLAGVGDDQGDIDAARALVKQVLSEVIQSGDGPEDTFEKDYSAAKNASSDASRTFGEALARNRAAIDAARDAAEAAGRPIPSSLSGWLAYDPNIPADLRQAAQGVNAAESRMGEMRKLDGARTARNRQKLADDVSNAFSDLWAGVKRKYNEAIAAIDNGTWKTGLCKLGVDAGFLVVETAVGVALAAALTPAVAAVLKIVSKVVEEGSQLVRIAVRATRTKLGNAKAAAHADKTFKRAIDTSKELTAAEKKILGAENQGNTVKTPDAGAAEPKGGAGAGKAWKPKEVNGRKVYQRDDLIDPKRVDADGRTNLQRMRDGDAPIGPDGRELNLHHVTQTEPGPMAELTATKHSENQRLLHTYANQYDKTWRDADGVRRRYQSAPETMNRGPFDRWREKYWITRAADFE